MQVKEIVTEKPEIGDVVNFYDTLSDSPKSRKCWMVGKVLTGNTESAFLIVRANGTAYLSFPKDIRKPKTPIPFKFTAKAEKSWGTFVLDELKKEAIEAGFTVEKANAVIAPILEADANTQESLEPELTEDLPVPDLVAEYNP